MKRPGSVSAWVVLLAVLSRWLWGCESSVTSMVTPPVDASPATWPCPSEWVAAARGGCGPAVVLCAPDGGAAPGACAGVDLSRAHPVGDGGAGESFRLDPDGQIAGAWRLPGEAGGPPAPTWSPDAGVGSPPADWRPDAGIPTCPPGWTRTAEGLCDVALRACPEGAESLPGGGCTTTAAADCPTAPYADPGPAATGATRAYVRADAPAACAAGAERGTTECPWRTITEGVATGRAWVLVGDGTYPERLDVTTTLHLLGRCAARVQLLGAGAEPTVLARGSAALDLSGVAVAGDGVGIDVADAAAVRVQSVRVSRVVRSGVRVMGTASFEGRDLVIADTRQQDGERGYGVSFGSTRPCALERTALVRNVNVGALAKAGRVTLRDSVVVGTRLAPTADFGSGIFANERAELHLERVWVTDNDDTGVTVEGVDTRATMTDVAVRGTRRLARLTDVPNAVLAQNGVALTAERLLCDDNAGHGVRVEAGATASGMHGAIPEVTLRDSVIRGPRVSPAGSRQVGLFAQIGSHVRTFGVRIVDAVDVGVIATGDETVVTLEDTQVTGTRINSAPTGTPLGCGVKVEAGAKLVGRRVRVADSAWAGLLVDAPSDGSDRTTPDLTLTDSVVSGNRYGAQRGNGGGVFVQRGGDVLIERVTFTGNEGKGVLAIQATATVVDSVFEEAIGVPRMEIDGRVTVQAQHLSAQDHATVAARGVVLRAGRGATGAVAAGEAAVITLDGGLCEGLSQTPSMITCNGVWPEVVPCLVAEQGGRLTATRVALRRALGIAAYAQIGGSFLSLADSVVQGTRSTPNTASTPSFGRALSVWDRAEMRVERVLVEDNPGTGVLAADEGTVLTLSRVVVRDTRAMPDGRYGQGVFAQEGAAVSADRVVISGSTTSGLFSTTGAAVSISDSLVTDVHPSPVGGIGDGMDALRGGSVTAERVVIRRVFIAGLTSVESGSLVTARDVIVLDVRADPAQLARGVLSVGQGLWAAGGGITGERVALVDLTGFAATASGPRPPAAGPSRVALSDLFLRNVRPTLTREAPLDQPYGFALLAQRDTVMEVDRAAIDLGTWAFVVSGGTMNLRHVVATRQSQALGMSSTSAANTRLTREDVVGRDNLLNDFVYNQSSAEVALSSDIAQCESISACTVSGRPP